MSDNNYLESMAKEQEKKFADDAATYENVDKELRAVFDTAVEASNIPKIKEAYQRALAVQSDIKTLEREISHHTDGKHMFTVIRD